MQVNGRFLQITMTEQHLDGSKIGTGFQQMSSEAVTQGVRMDAFVL